MRRRWLTYVALLAGCVDGFEGSNIQIDLSPRTPPQAPPSRAPSATELPSNIHFRLYAIKETDDRDALFELQRFEIHRIVDPSSPCFIDAGPSAPFPGLHVTQFARKVNEVTGISDPTNPPDGSTQEQQILAATAKVRMDNLAVLAGEGGVKAVTSASAGAYPDVDADCAGAGLPPAMCIEDGANARRLQICRAAWAADPLLFEGTDRVLTSPLNGTTFGFVDGANPVTQTPVGGAQLFVDNALDGVDEYAIFFQTDGIDEPGTLFLSGRPAAGGTRGVTHVHLESPLFPSAELAIFANLDEDDVHF